MATIFNNRKVGFFKNTIKSFLIEPTVYDYFFQKEVVKNEKRTQKKSELAEYIGENMKTEKYFFGTSITYVCGGNYITGVKFFKINGEGKRKKKASVLIKDFKVFYFTIKKIIEDIFSQGFDDVFITKASSYFFGPGKYYYTCCFGFQMEEKWEMGNKICSIYRVTKERFLEKTKIFEDYILSLEKEFLEEIKERSLDEDNKEFNALFKKIREKFEADVSNGLFEKELLES